MWASTCEQIVLVIPVLEHGRTVEVQVQQKLSPEWRQMEHIAGPGTVRHQSGPGDVETSGPIVLPRPLAREGRDSYLCRPMRSWGSDDGNAEVAEYEAELDKEELLGRCDLESDGEGKATLTLHLSASRHGADEAHAKRKRIHAFAMSPQR